MGLVKAAGLQRARDLLATERRVDRSALPVPIADSWERCAPLFTHLGETGTAISDAAPHDRWEEYLVDAAADPISNLTDQLGELVGGVVLCTPAGRLLRVSCPDLAGSEALDTICMLPGAQFGEAVVGTNGIGTPVAARRPFHVIGAQHLREEYRDYTCAGVPLCDPGTGHLLGGLSIVACGEQAAGALMEAATAAAAQSVQHELLTRTGGVKTPLVQLFNARGRTFAGPVLAFAPTLAICNASAASLSPEDLRLLRNLAHHTIHSSAIDETTVLLPSGGRVRVHRTLLSAEDRGTGVLFELEPAVATPAPVRERPAGHSRALTSLHLPRTASPVWQQTRRDIDAALRRSENVLVTGETGTGKTALALAALDRVRSGTPRVLLEPEDLERRVRGRHAPLPRSARVAVVRDIHLLSATAVASLRRLLLDRASPIQLIATFAQQDGTADGQTFTALLPLFAHTCAVPPLRRHPLDLPAIAAEMLRTLSPVYQKRLSADAIDQLMHCTWPGNLEQLHDVLTGAVANSCTRVIGPSDLAAFVRDGGSLSMMERAERDAILRALYDADRNRSQAAAALGISRSTLYRRLTAYGIDTA